MVSNEVWPLEQDASESGSKWGGFEMNEKVKTSDIDRRIWDLKFEMDWCTVTQANLRDWVDLNDRTKFTNWVDPMDWTY